MKKLSIFILGLCASMASFADTNAAKALGDILAQYHSLTGNFVQTSIDSRDSDDKTEQKSTGSMSVLRPDFFRWDTITPMKQHIISDGKNIWVYDVDLEQVTIEPMQQVMGEAPASLLTQSTEDLMRNFNVEQKVTNQAGQWFVLEPKKKQDLYHKITLNFIQNKLNRMEIDNAAGQATMVQFTDVKINPSMPKDSFKIRIPKDVDVIGKAQ